VTRTEVYRVSRQARAKALRQLADADEAGLIDEYSIHAPSDRGARFSFTLADGRRDLDLAGVRQEPDEYDFDDGPTDVDHSPR